MFTQEVTEASLLNVPHEYMCPISMDLMQDPVIASEERLYSCPSTLAYSFDFAGDGFSYDRKSIVTWLRTSRRSPRTNLMLRNRVLIPNRALRALIQDWQQKQTPHDGFADNKSCLPGNEPLDTLPNKSFCEDPAPTTVYASKSVNV